MKKAFVRILDQKFGNQFRMQAVSETTFPSGAPSETTCYETAPQVLLGAFFISIGSKQTLIHPGCLSPA